jgi:2-polyprenyl-6-methoxyphenol hydroxylase-like FAD-dependent oxidoreductase
MLSAMVRLEARVGAAVPHRIGVVGAGYAGTAAACFLADAGHEVVVFERVAEPSPVGAGILLQPTGMAVLERLGLLPAVLARAARVDTLQCHDHRGRIVLDLHYDDLAPGLFGAGLHRGALYEALLAATRARPVEVRCGEAVAAIGRRQKLPTIVTGGGDHGPFDLVVVAGGAHHEIAGCLPLRATPYPWGAAWFVAPSEGVEIGEGLVQRVRGARQMLGLLPTGLGPGTGDGPLVSLFWSLRCDDVDAWRRRGLAAWRDEMLALQPLAEPLVDRIEDIDEVLVARYWDVAMEPWHGRGVVHLGDSAHAMSPQLGQGANLAIYDAMVLAEAVAEHARIDDALVAYSRRRRAHLSYYQLVTRALTPFFQSDSRVLPWLRDTFMGVACRVPWVRTTMLASMAGVEQGLLAPRLPFAAPEVEPAC